MATCEPFPPQGGSGPGTVAERAAVVIDGDGAEPGEPPAASQRSAQPGFGLDPGLPRHLDPDTPPAELLDEMALAGAEQARTAQENDQRCAADRELVAALAAEGFAGRLYEHFKDSLARYALAVLRAWMCSGDVFQRTAARGFDLRPSSDEIEQLCNDPQARNDLANVIVAKALPWFREHALVEGAWSPAGGACLTTYFTGTCLFFFPNELRAWRRDQQRRALLLRDDRDLVLFAGADDRDPGPEAAIVGDGWIRHYLSRADERVRPILALRLNGYSYDEIVELLDETSIRAVEGVVHRWRKKEQNELRRVGPDERP